MNIEQEYIQKVAELPPCPEVALQVMTMAQDNDCNFDELAETVGKDAHLTANMLKMANSVFFGCMRQISTIKDMIIRLGLENVKLIAITSAAGGILNPAKQTYGLATGALWRHSYATAVMAAIIGRHAEVEAGATLYTSALLHDVGKVILDRPLFFEIYNREAPEQKMSFVDYEDFMLHTNHAKVGRALLESWGLPEEICAPVGRHHSGVELESEDLHSRIVYLANLLIENMGFLLADPSHYNFEAASEPTPRFIMQEVPNFEANRELIIDEFFERYSDGLAFL